MPAHILAIVGPMKRETGENHITWSFAGVRANGDYARWRLTFWFDSRRFTTKPMDRHPSDDERAARLAQLPEVKRQTPQSGRVTDMLRARLSSQDIAEATRLAIKHGGRP